MSELAWKPKMCHGAGLVPSVGNGQGDQGVVLFVGMETRTWFYLWAWRPRLSSICGHGNKCYLWVISMETRAWFYLCTWRPGLGSICGHGNQGLVLFVPPGDIQLVLNKRPKPLSACSSYAILFLKIPRLFCRVLKSLVQCGRAKVERNSRAEM